MRLMMDTIVAVLLVAALGAVLYWHRSERAHLADVEAVQQAVRAIHTQAMYRASIGEVHANADGFAKQISTAWFNPLPKNRLVDEDVAWLEHAPAGQQRLPNPPWIVADAKHASFWYNPQRGVVRARVPHMGSDEATVALYNLVNGTNLRRSDLYRAEDGEAGAPPGATAGATAKAEKRSLTGPRQSSPEATRTARVTASP